MKRLIILPIAVAMFIVSVQAQGNATPKFTAYHATVEKPRVRAIDFRENPDARTFRTRLSEALRRGVNFAGHYVLAGWGCGTGCISGAIIDARTGDVFWPEQLYAVGVWHGKDEYADEPVAYRKNSRLLIITGIPGQKDDNTPDKPSGVYYYEWKNNRLREIKFVPKPTG